ncbi:hypothetical protein RclHR1_00290025 [Rhizophagus clarus]|uniref:Uncharacterized protein n=1 Tax=Rhizophagus clarus TaxID=94130 RepID=A0A2Z6R3Q8_9GLOM|nr:hypothetical protein RclHR1_00290025 [Rhizophagus clarus]
MELLLGLVRKIYRNILLGEVVVCEQSAIEVTTYGGHGSGKVIPTTFMADTVVMPDPERATLVLVTGRFYYTSSLT